MTLSSQQNEAEQEAMRWQARLSSDLITEQQKKEFQRWLTHREENRLAWQEVNAFWQGLDSLSEADIHAEVDNTTSTEAGSSSVVEFTSPRKPIKTLSGNGFKSKPQLALAASILLTVSMLFNQADKWLADYRTAPGEQRVIELSDGSRVVLNSESALSVDYNDGERRIELHNGEAYFSVAADASRPFVVAVENGRIRALGTEFNIKDRNHDVTVTVFEHAVRVTLDNGTVVDRLPEGGLVSFNDENIAQPADADLERIQSWRDRQMIFQDKALADVITELNHYRSGMIWVVGDDIEELPVTGIFDTADTDVALKTIEQSLPVKINRLTDQWVVIRPK